MLMRGSGERRYKVSVEGLDSLTSYLNQRPSIQQLLNHNVQEYSLQQRTQVHINQERSVPLHNIHEKIVMPQENVLYYVYEHLQSYEEV